MVEGHRPGPSPWRPCLGMPLNCLCWCCLQFQPLVKHADSVLNLSKRIVGSTLVNFGVKHTFFAHFCAGEPCMPPMDTGCQGQDAASALLWHLAVDSLMCSVLPDAVRSSILLHALGSNLHITWVPPGIWWCRQASLLHLVVQTSIAAPPGALCMLHIL